MTPSICSARAGRVSGVAIALVTALASSLWAPAAQAADTVDTAAAEALIKKNGCGKCHSVDKQKDGPSYKETAAKLKGKADAEAELVKHLTSGPMIKVDGKEEEHKKVKAGDEAEVRNLARWILSR